MLPGVRRGRGPGPLPAPRSTCSPRTQSRPPGGAAAGSAEVTARLRRDAPPACPPGPRRAPQPGRTRKGRARPRPGAARAGKGPRRGEGKRLPGPLLPTRGSGPNREQSASARSRRHVPRLLPLPSNMAPPRARSCRRRADFVMKLAAPELRRGARLLSPVRLPGRSGRSRTSAENCGGGGGGKRRARRPRPSCEQKPMRRGPGRDRSPQRCPHPGAPRPLPRGATEHKSASVRNSPRAPPPPPDPRPPPGSSPPAASFTAAAVPELGVGGERSPRAAAAASAPRAALFWRRQLPPAAAPGTAQTFPDGPSPRGPRGQNPRPRPPPAAAAIVPRTPPCPARPGGSAAPRATLARRGAPGPERGRRRGGGREGGGGTHCSGERRARFFKSPSFQPLPPRVRAREAPRHAPFSWLPPPPTHTPSYLPGH